MVLAWKYVVVIVKALITYWSVDSIFQLIRALGWGGNWLGWLQNPAAMLFRPDRDVDEMLAQIKQSQLQELSLSERRQYDIMVMGGRQAEADAFLSKALLQRRCSVLPQFPGVDPDAMTETRRTFALTLLTAHERELYDFLVGAGQTGAADEMLKIVINRAAAVGAVPVTQSDPYYDYMYHTGGN